MISAVRLNPSLAEELRSSGDHILLTGATGWLGKAFLEASLHALGKDAGGRLHAFSSRADAVRLQDGLTYPTKPMAALADLSAQPTYRFFHFAFLTKEKQSLMPLEVYAATNRGLRADVMQALQRLHVRGLCVTSSGAVYGKQRQLCRDLEAYPYAALKVEDEEVFTTFCEGRIPLQIPRIFNISGAYINKWDAYALANLLRMAIAGEDLVIQAHHPVLRSYCAVGDIVNVLMKNMANSQPLLFDVSSSQLLEIGELAQRICQVLDIPISRIRRHFDATQSEDRYTGESAQFESLIRQLGVSPLVIDDQIRQTHAYMKQAMRLSTDAFSHA